MTKTRVIQALRAAANALDPTSAKKAVKASSSGQVFIGLVVAPALGAWIDVSSDEDELQETIDAVVAKARLEEPESEEWMVSDYDDFPNLGEYPGVEKLAKVAKLLEDHEQEIVEAALSEEGGDVDDAESLLDEGYAVYESEAEYGEQFVDDLGIENIKNPEWYIDMDMLARDLLMDADIHYVNSVPYVFHR